MFRLGTFGGLSLAGQDGAPIAIQRLRLALLALLAHAGERGLSRDKLLGFLWADSSPDSARHKLEQALYMLRRQLGEALFLGTDPVRLNPELLTADVTEFEHALKRDPAEAAFLYKGPYLDGFYLTGAEEFERWVESERGRLAERYRWALEQLAKRSAAQGDATTAVEWWRKLAAVDPLSAQAMMGLMRALASAGDRPAALRQAQIYEQLVRQELGSEPDPAIRAVVEELRAAKPTPVRVPDQSAEQPVPRDVVPDAARETRSAPKAPATDGRRPRIPLALPAAVAVGLLLALALRHQAPARSRVDSSAAHRIVIVPFRVTTPDSSLTYLREGMVDLLAAKLTGEVGPVAVDPRTTLSAWRRATASEGTDNQAAEVRLAHGVGAGQILRGDIVQVGGDLVLNGTVFSADDQDVRARASVSGPADSLLVLVDRLANSLLALQAGEGAHRLALLTSTSIPALHAYLDGRSAYRHGESGVAMTDYARALELDSTFALAALELVASSGWVFTITTDWAYRIPLGPGGQVGQVMRYQLSWVRAMDLAWKNRERLSRRDFATLMAFRGPRYPEGRRARELFDAWWGLAQDAPDRADIWYIVGYILSYQGPAMGIRDAAEQASSAFHKALALDPEFAPPLAGLLELAAQREDTAEVHRLGAEYLARDSTGPSADYVRWHVAAVTRDSARLKEIRARFESIDLESLDRIQWTSQMEGIDLEDADRAMKMMIRRSPNDSGYVLFYANMLALNRGRPREALRLMEGLRKLGWANYDWLRMMYGTHWDSNREAAAQSARRVEAATGPPVSDPLTHWGLVQWWLAQGDTARALKDCELLRSDAVARDQIANQFQVPLLASLLIASIRRRPNLPVLLARADSFTAGGCCNTHRFDNVFLARLEERAGDLPSALAAVRRQRWFFPPEYLSTSLREEGRLSALTGDTAGAVAAYRHYLALRSDPEPELRPDAEHIRQELERLERAR